MTKPTLLAVAAFAAAIASTAKTLAGEAPAEASDTPAEDKPNKGRRGAAKDEPPTSAAPTGKTVEQLKALIQPLIEGGQGADVKAAIGKHSNGGTKIADMMNFPQNHDAFAKDIEALSF